MNAEISENAIATLLSLGEEIGFGWRRHTIKTRSTDALLNICIGDGIIPTKIDGWIHACTLTTKSLAKYARDKNRRLDVEQVTSWTGGNAAQRYARWQVDFHWKIDTRPWQYFLYLFTMKAAIADAIESSERLCDKEKKALHDLNRQFWEEVIVVYTYRSEVIERSRGYAPHPDPSCGSSWQGYPYAKIWNREDVQFDSLSLPFLEKGTSDDEGVEGKIAPAPFPVVDGQFPGEIPGVAKAWIETAMTSGTCDEWPRVPLGDRWVPTRFNGWWASVELIDGPLKLYASGQHAVGDESILPGHDAGDYAVRFALCQLEFQRRLKGEPIQLTALMRDADGALRKLATGRCDDPSKVASFIETFCRTIETAPFEAMRFSEEQLPELVGSRPLHPRFAPVDPLEPLPWEVENPERYLAKMRKLGYTL